MNVEALPPDGGVARAFVNTIEHIRLRDLASAVPGLQADPRWPTIHFFDTAARMFVEHSGIEGVMLNNLPKRGRYVPRDQLQPAIDYFTSSATIAEAQNRTWAGINANRKRKKQVMQPIEITPIYPLDGFSFEMVASNLDRSLRFSTRNSTIEVSVSDIAALIGFGMTDAPKLLRYTGITSTKTSLGGRRLIMMSLADISDFLEGNSLRSHYAPQKVQPLLKRLDELQAKIGGELLQRQLTKLEGTSEPQPDAVQIVAATMGAGAEMFPPVNMSSPTPEFAQFRRQHGHRWVEDSDASRAEKLEELKKVQPDPDTHVRPSTTEEVVRRMGLVEASQEAMIERMDRILALDSRADQMPILIEIRDGLVRQVKAVAVMKHQAGEEIAAYEGMLKRTLAETRRQTGENVVRYEATLQRATHVIEEKDRQIGHLVSVNADREVQIKRLEEEIAHRARQYDRLAEVTQQIGNYCATLIGVTNSNSR